MSIITKQATYTDFYEAVEALYPNVINVDLFLEKLTDAQVVVLTAYINDCSCVTSGVFLAAT